MSTLQDSLYGTDCHLAPLTQRHTPAFTPPVARGMRSLLRGSLAITATGLSPASRHRLQDTPLMLRPACSPSRFNDLLHQRLQQSRCLHRCSDCYRVERTSSRAGLTPAVDHHLFTAHTVTPLIKS